MSISISSLYLQSIEKRPLIRTRDRIRKEQPFFHLASFAPFDVVKVERSVNVIRHNQ